LKASRGFELLKYSASSTHLDVDDVTQDSEKSPILDYGRRARTEPPFGFLSLLVLIVNPILLRAWPDQIVPDIHYICRSVAWSILSVVGMALAYPVRNSIGWRLAVFVSGLSLNVVALVLGAIVLMMGIFDWSRGR
jgi:hypothetical protein